MPTTTDLLQKIYTAYREKRLDDVLALFSDDFRFTLHLPQGTIPGAGIPNNKAETAAMLQSFIDTYDFLDYDPDEIQISPDGEHATASPLIRYRHKASGQVIQTRLSHFWSVREGKARSLDEYHDTARVEAFLARVATQ